MLSDNTDESPLVIPSAYADAIYLYLKSMEKIDSNTYRMEFFDDSDGLKKELSYSVSDLCSLMEDSDRLIPLFKRMSEDFVGDS